MAKTKEKKQKLTLEELFQFIYLKKQDLDEIISQKQREFETVVREMAQNLRLGEVTAAVDYETQQLSDLLRRHGRFNAGDIVEVPIYQHRYCVVISPDGLALQTCNAVGRVVVKTFKGGEAVQYSRKFESAMLKCQTEEDENVPF